MNWDELKKNHKTAFLVEMHEKLLKDEAEVLEMAKDASMREMAEADLKNIAEQKKNVEDQINAILESEKEEVEIPNELILEVRAGAGGDRARTSSSSSPPAPPCARTPSGCAGAPPPRPAASGC